VVSGFYFWNLLSEIGWTDAQASPTERKIGRGIAYSLLVAGAIGLCFAFNDNFLK
jgi:hypothetical protein